MLVRGFDHADPIQKRKLYRKANTARALLRPYGEGISLYMQFDYFPTNFFSNFSSRTRLDALIEMVVSHRYSFQNFDRLPIQELGERAFTFFRDERLRASTFKKKVSLLMQPLGVSARTYFGLPHYKASGSEY